MSWFRKLNPKAGAVSRQPASSIQRSHSAVK